MGCGCGGRAYWSHGTASYQVAPPPPPEERIREEFARRLLQLEEECIRRRQALISEYQQRIPTRPPPPPRRLPDQVTPPPPPPRPAPSPPPRRGPPTTRPTPPIGRIGIPEWWWPSPRPILITAQLLGSFPIIEQIRARISEIRSRLLARLGMPPAPAPAPAAPVATQEIVIPREEGVEAR